MTETPLSSGFMCRPGHSRRLSLQPTSGLQLTTQRSRRLVSLAVRTVMLVGATSGGACRVWMTLDDWLKGLAPTTFTCLMRNLEVKRQTQLFHRKDRQNKTPPPSQKVLLCPCHEGCCPRMPSSHLVSRKMQISYLALSPQSLQMVNLFQCRF